MFETWPLVGREDELDRVAEALASGPGVVLSGEAGVGKTRLIDEALQSVERDGRSAEWVRATDAARSVAFGALAHVVGRVEDAGSREEMLHGALALLAERGETEGLVLAVDDAHLLDDSSLALVHLAATQSPVTVLVSVRSGEPAPDALVALWKDDLLPRIDLGPLSRLNTERLVEEVLGDGVPARLIQRVWDLSRGNALFVRELVMVALERRRRGAAGAPFLVSRAEQPAQRLADLVGERVRLLDDTSRAALETVAVGEQVPLEAMEQLSGAAALEDLEVRQLVNVRESGAGPMVEIAHPLYGEVLAGSLPALRRRRILRDLVASLDDLPGVDPLRVGVWRLESGDPGGADELVDLAREALGRFDHALAQRFAESAGGTARAAAGLVLGEALTGQQRNEEAEEVLASLQPVDPSIVARVAVARASNLFWALDRSQDALEVLERAEEELADEPTWRMTCRSQRAFLLIYVLDMDGAIGLAEQVLESPDARPPARFRALVTASVIRSLRGRTDEALAALGSDVVAEARGYRAEFPYGDLQIALAKAVALYMSGRVHELHTFAEAHFRPEIEHAPLPFRSLIDGLVGLAAYSRGHTGTAYELFTRSAAGLAEGDWFGFRVLAEAMRARAAVFAGRPEVESALANAEAVYGADPVRHTFAVPFLESARAWAAFASGERSQAVERYLSLAAMAETFGPAGSAEAFHDIARMGRPHDVVEPLARLAGRVDGPMVGPRADHARALADDDPEALEAVAGQFEALGAELLAAEAHRAAANRYRQRGHGARGEACARRVGELLERCGRPVSPAMEREASGGEDLTERELEVASLAAQGLTSQEVAERLYVSVRTVDTHLYRAYRKLMVEGRHELADALGIPRRGHANT